MRFKRSRRRSSYRPSGTVKVQGVLEAVIRDRGWFGKFDERRIFNVWDSIAGEGMASHSQPVSISGGILRVEVSHHVFAQELSMMKNYLIEQLKTQLRNRDSSMRKSPTRDRIVDIQFHFNPNFVKQKSTWSVLVSESVSSTEKAVKPVSSEKEEQIKDTVSVIEDAELRDALKALFLTQSSHKETAE